jgi:FecR protein
MRITRWKVAFGSCFLAALLTIPMWGSETTDRRTAMPGTLNYVEGQASIGDQTLDSHAVGNADLQNGQVLETGNGKAEILLTPGVYLRVGSNSSVKMISNSLTNTEVTVSEGEAMVEVDELYHENNLRISQPGADTKLLKTGLYHFDASNGAVRVFDGKAVVTADDHNITVNKNHELAFNNNPKLKAQGFDKDQVTKTDDLYRWSSLRSQYLSEANINAAQRYYVNGWYGPGWWGPGWYWDPFFAGYTFLPGSGFFYNPFGWGFYSPLMVWRAPVVIGGGFRHFDGSRPVAIGHGFHNHAVTAFHRGYGQMGGGFHGGPVRSGGMGSFHGGGGGHR